ncbi:MAG: peptide chain release factor N(5)-glutamine methyltransferase [Acidobacteria bacterium]|nr:peptide chain release factor N(5)-glutamine methyltransferase [Acidobacteriota bacterium]
MPTVCEALRQADSVFRKAGIPNAERDARLLLTHATGKELSWVLSHPEFELERQAWELFGNWVDQRAAGRPVSYLLGWKEFYGRDFIVSPAVLIPRPETEILIEQGLKILACVRGGENRVASAGRRDGDASERLAREPVLLLADIGTGSGCVAITLAAEIPQAFVVATDISKAALQVAGENAIKHGVSERIRFQKVDLLPESPERFDAIFSNPPYVAAQDAQLEDEVRKNEPAVALFAGNSGMEMYRRIVPVAAERLKPGGWLVLELGYQSEKEVLALIETTACWQNVEVVADLQGIARCLVAQRT